MHVILRLVILAALVQDGLCCGRGRKKGKGGKSPSKQTPEDAVGNLLGPDVKTSPYTPAGDSPQTCDGLSCNFESSCCWTNALPPADQLNWMKASGKPDEDKMKKNFKTSTLPEGSYLVTASATPGSESQTAQFYSCPISCANSDITVKLKHWQTESVKIQVCSETDPAGPPQNCQDLPTEGGKQDTATLPKGQNQRVVIQATGFTAKDGSAAIISNLEVMCDPCPAETTPTTTMAQPPGETTTLPTGSVAPSTVCKDLQCNFEDGSLCNYQSAGTANMNWANQKVPFHNRLTGVPKPAEGQSFAGSYTKAKQGEKSTLTAKTNFDKDYVVRCKFFDDTDGLSFKGCCNDESNCPYDSKEAVQIKDYQTWRTASFTCKTGTTQVIFVGDNTKGANEGAVAIDDIQVLQPADPPDSASQSACMS